VSAALKILDRLTRTKLLRAGQWKAACPCCESRKGWPLAITEKDDGRVLIHAFCGCSTEDVLGRLGLEISDLFDRPLAVSMPPAAARVSASEVLTEVDHEATVLAIISNDIMEHREISDATWERLATSARRLGHAADYINERAK
jgi:hypothetical protein